MKRIIILIILVLAVLLGGAFGFRKWQKKQITEKEKDIVNVDLCIKSGYPLVKTGDLLSECRTPGGKSFELHELVEQQKLTDKELVENYKKGGYTIIGSKINPYDSEQEIIIITFHDYKKFNEPPPVSCGTRSTDCYVFLRTKNIIDVIARFYSATSPYKVDLEGDFSSGITDDAPLIKFTDKDSVVLHSIGGFSGEISFIKINLKTKEVEILKNSSR